MKEYHKLVIDTLTYGTRKTNRTGVDTISNFNYNYKVDLRNGYPLLTTKKMAWKAVIHELLWFLSGQDHVRDFRKVSRIWNEWAKEDGSLDTAYGWYWRNFPSANGGRMQKVPSPGHVMGYEWVPSQHTVHYVDQIKNVINELKNNRNSRRLVVSAWEPGNAWTSKLPPCHLMFIFNVQYDEDDSPYLNVHLTQRSADIALGVPFNIASYSLLLMLMGREVGLPVRFFAHTLIDCHVYTSKPDGSMAEYDHVPGLKLQLSREPRSFPTLTLPNAPLDEIVSNWVSCVNTDDKVGALRGFELLNYNPHEKIDFKVAE